MSLLLDALKKAAEQKAAKNKQDLTEPPSSDETVLNPGPEHVSAREGGVDGGTQQSSPALPDETEIDESETASRL